MIAHSSQREKAEKVAHFRPDLKLAPQCAQCRITMVVMRGEPDLE
jgi:hypothetical protein